MAATVAFTQQRRVMPPAVRHLGQRAADRAMRWLDSRRSRLDNDYLA